MTMTLPIIPVIEFQETDYAKLRLRFDLYDDMVAATRFDEQGQAGAVYAVDPYDVGAALGNLSFGSGLLPRNCLFWSKKNGLERLGIWVEPRVWAVSIEGEKETWHVPMPGLVFVGQGQAYNLYALKTTEWPHPESRLYMAPCPNVRSDLGICTGNAPFPVAGSGTIWTALAVFFESGFNRHLADAKSTQFKDILTRWRLLHQAGAKTYPLDELVEIPLKLRSLVEGA